MRRNLAAAPPKRPRRVGRRATVLAASAAFGMAFGAAPAVSSAASVRVEDGVVQFVAAKREQNRVWGDPHEQGLAIRDDGAPLSAGPGCEDLGDVVVCQAFEAEVRVLDGADQVRLEHFGNPSTIWGGDGNDEIYGGSGAGSTTIHGEAGSDNLRTSNNGADAIVTGGSGDDVLTIGEATGGYFSGGGGNDTIRYNPLSDDPPWLAAPLSAKVTSVQPVIEGGTGNDEIEAGLLPAERINGGPGVDSLMYFGGGTIDAALSNLEIVIAWGGHTVLGTKRADRLISRGGDAIYARGGNDFVDVRNGSTDDIVDCGAGLDEVRADPGDSIASNCELVL
jgi:hypothetical protein